MKCSSCIEPCLNDWCSTKDSEMECKECEELASTLDKLVERNRLMKINNDILQEALDNNDKAIAEELQRLRKKVTELELDIELMKYEENNRD